MEKCKTDAQLKREEEREKKKLERQRDAKALRQEKAARRRKPRSKTAESQCCNRPWWLPRHTGTSSSAVVVFVSDYNGLKGPAMASLSVALR